MTIQPDALQYEVTASANILGLGEIPNLIGNFYLSVTAPKTVSATATEVRLHDVGRLLIKKN